MSATLLIGIGLLGGFGALFRFLLDGAVSARTTGDFPWGTLTVNLLGAFILGVLVGAGLRGDGLHLVALGLLGGFTTFSTWAFESHRLAEVGLVRLSVANFTVSLILGIAAVWVGQLVGGLL